LKVLDDRQARFASTAERALLRRLEGGCQVPLGALGLLSGTSLHLHAAVCALDGSRMLAAQGETAATLEGAANLGRKLADELLSKGAGELIAQERGSRREAGAP
jgi:hydroxymethylbilane synthase